jgi:transcriptional regulator with XRE-family HTH domain
MTGKKILECRKLKGLSQEELSEMSKISVRTIQRIENGNNIPRGKTLLLLCSVLGLDIQELLPVPEETAKKTIAETIISYFFVILLNLIIMLIFGFLTLDSEANANSKLGALFLAVLIPLFIVEKTRQMQPVVRLLKFGGQTIQN